MVVRPDNGGMVGPKTLRLRLRFPPHKRTVRPCKFCDTPFKQVRERILFCCTECAQTWMSIQFSKYIPCRVCGNPIKETPTQTHQRLHCSWECRRRTESRRKQGLLLAVYAADARRIAIAKMAPDKKIWWDTVGIKPACGNLYSHSPERPWEIPHESLKGVQPTKINHAATPIPENRLRWKQGCKPKVPK